MLLSALGWIAFTCATMRWLTWGVPIARHYATDELQYETIARAAPGLPDTKISAAASQRFVSHWLVGAAADVTGLGLHTVYRIATWLCLLAIAAVAVRLVVAFDLPLGAGVVALGLVITNPYAWRLPLIAPAMLSDTVLVLGIGIALLGLVENSPPLAIAGCVVAVLGREMGLAVMVVVCVWLLWRRRFAAAAAAFVVPAAAFGVVKLVGETFSFPDPSAAAFTVVSPILRLPGSARELADHFGRVAIAAPAALALVAAGILVARRVTRPLELALVVAAVVFLQPAAFNPDWVQHNETRLAALAIVPLALAAAAAFALTAAARSRAVVGAAVVLVAVASLQHRYTWTGTFLSPKDFVALETAAALALAVLVLWRGREARVLHSPA